MSEVRMTIRLDSDMRDKVRQLAKQTGRSESDVVRSAIEEYCRNGEQPPTMYDIAKKAGIIGIAKNLPPDLSTNPKYMEGFGE